MDQSAEHAGAGDEPGVHPRNARVEASTPRRARPIWRAYLKLARPTQWSKSAFVLVGPLYAIRDLPKGTNLEGLVVSSLLAAAAFALVSSACYVVNDILDRVADRAHPRKRHRPIASGEVGVQNAWLFAGVLLMLAAGTAAAIRGPGVGWTVLALALYGLNVMAYSFFLKHLIIVDVICLALGFVLRVMGGCAAAGVEPSAWLLNVVFFLSMFLAFGKRLGERRVLGGDGRAGSAGAAEHRPVQAGYTDGLLQMAVVVTGVSTILTYGSYVQSLGAQYVAGFNLMWLTMLPAFYCLFRAIVMLDRGKFDDPTELAVHDRAFQVSAGTFGVMTMLIFIWASQPR